MAGKFVVTREGSHSLRLSDPARATKGGHPFAPPLFADRGTVYRSEMEEADGLLIVWHSRTGGARQMAEAALAGACQEGQSRARLVACIDVAASDLLGAGGYLFVCPENLAAMSGAMKEFFDRTYYPVLGKIEGRPYATAIAAGSDGAGATRQIDRIATGWRLRRVAEPLIVNFAAQTPEAILRDKILGAEDREVCAALGQVLAEGLAMGIF